MRIWKATILTAAACCWIGTTQAAEEAKMVSKAVHGIGNAAGCWIELPVQIVKGYDRGLEFARDTPAISHTGGTVHGIFRGIGHTAGRAGLGVYQMAAFWAANPYDNELYGTHFDGEWAWDEGVYEDLTLNQTIEGVARKFTRGIGNVVLGIAAWPIETRKGGIEGVGRGLWFGVSRILHGAYEVVTFPFPNQLDNYGYSYGPDYPWTADGEIRP